MKNYLYLPLLLPVTLTSCSSFNNNKENPNLILIYVDDLGYADVGCYGAKSVETPNIDRLAQNGIIFTDAHCTAATCTPSRFSLLTGSYAFRNNARILPGDAPLLIRPGTETLPSMLQKSGYTTGIVGKWHLGLGQGELDWNDSIKPGPLEVGFDYSFIIPATGDRVPCVFIENHHVVGLDPDDPVLISYKKIIGNEPTGLSNPELLKFGADTQHSLTIVNGISRIGYMSGGHSAHWKDEEFPDVLTGKAIEFIKNNRENPFFLFFSLHDIHVPRVPNSRFQGQSDMGPRGDVIVQVDWCTGQIVKILEDLGIENNTLLIFTSDNGPVLNDGYEDQSVELIGDHNPSGPFRGGKYSAFEAGTRIPTITYWPSVIKPGRSNALVNQVDIFASMAKLTGYGLKKSDAPDSFDMLSVFLGKSLSGRNIMIEESSTLSLRMGNWKYIKPKNEGSSYLQNKGIETGLSKDFQLYDLFKDIGEQQNLTALYPDTMKIMQSILEEIIKSEGSRPNLKK